MKENFYTVNEVVDKGLVFGYKRRKIFYLIESGELEHLDLAKGRNKHRDLRIPQTAIDKFIASRKTPPKQIKK